MEEFMSFDQLLAKIKEHPEYPYIIIDLFKVNDEEIDLWCSQRKTSSFELGKPAYRVIKSHLASGMRFMSDGVKHTRNSMPKKIYKSFVWKMRA